MPMLYQKEDVPLHKNNKIPIYEEEKPTIRPIIFNHFNQLVGTGITTLYDGTRTSNKQFEKSDSRFAWYSMDIRTGRIGTVQWSAFPISAMRK